MPKQSAKVFGLHDAIRLSRPDPNSKFGKQIPITDPIFFSKDQLKVGSILKYYGRHEPNTTWEVKAIWYDHPTYGSYLNNRGKNIVRRTGYRRHRVSSVVTLQDQIDIICRETGQKVNTTFSYISYSAIWRLANEI